mmetsp:Transcript_53248/g.105826  ORF Transcript_53248/g.105826 Transcript_53248/m.105826 type:complete len:276 (-) Transcript_53248:941-1768(-)
MPPGGPVRSPRAADPGSGPEEVGIGIVAVAGRPTGLKLRTEAEAPCSGEPGAAVETRGLCCRRRCCWSGVGGAEVASMTLELVLLMGPTHFSAVLLLAMSAVLLRGCRATLWEGVGLSHRDAELGGRPTGKLSLPAWIPRYGTRCTGVCGTDWLTPATGIIRRQSVPCTGGEVWLWPAGGCATKLTLGDTRPCCPIAGTNALGTETGPKEAIDAPRGDSCEVGCGWDGACCSSFARDVVLVTVLAPSRSLVAVCNGDGPRTNPSVVGSSLPVTHP